MQFFHAMADMQGWPTLAHRYSPIVFEQIISSGSAVGWDGIVTPMSVRASTLAFRYRRAFRPAAASGD